MDEPQIPRELLIQQLHAADQRVDEGGEYTPLEARIDYLTDQMNGRDRTQKTYARNWGWSQSRVSRNIEEIRTDAEEWMNGEANTQRVSNEYPAGTERKTEPRESGRSDGDAGTERVQDKFEETDLAEVQANTSGVSSSSEPKATTPSPTTPKSPSSSPPPQGEDEVEYPEGSWERKMARASLQGLRQRDGLSSAVVRQIERKGREAVLQEWADEFRKLVDLDGYSRQVVVAVMRWVFEEDDFWVGQGFASVKALRRKGRQGEEWKFDTMHRQWKSSTNGQTQRSRAGDPRGGQGNRSATGGSARERAGNYSGERSRAAADQAKELLRSQGANGADPG